MLQRNAEHTYSGLVIVIVASSESIEEGRASMSFIAQIPNAYKPSVQRYHSLGRIYSSKSRSLHTDQSIARRSHQSIFLFDIVCCYCLHLFWLRHIWSLMIVYWKLLLSPSAMGDKPLRRE